MVLLRLVQNCEIQRDEFEGQKLKTVSKDKIKSAKLQANINIKVQGFVAEQETIHQFTVSKIICEEKCCITAKGLCFPPKMCAT